MTGGGDGDGKGNGQRRLVGRRNNVAISCCKFTCKTNELIKS